ncbi:E3 ubiquitin-protein ligase parkin-like [Argonauta hians]
MATSNPNSDLKVSVCLGDKTSNLTVPDDVTIDNLLRNAISSLVNETEPIQNYRIIYAGSLLAGETHLKALNLRAASVLHIVNLNNKNNFSIKNEPKDQPYPLFDYYVYCYQCKNISSAKLRIKCQRCKQNHRFIIDKDHLPNSREDILNRTQSLHGTCNYNGCSGNTANFEFLCDRHPASTTSAVVLKHIFNNSHHTSCATCGDDLNPILIFPCQKAHVMCLDCFKIYCTQYLADFRFRLTNDGYSIRCPAHCEGSFIQEMHHFRILGDTKYTEYKDRACRAFVELKDTVYCPNPSCNECFEAHKDLKEVECATCQHKFCRQCSSNAHIGPCSRGPVENCDEYSEYESKAAKLIQKISKPCPKCEANVEKSGGCNHMTCRCGAEWCWVCCKMWSSECIGEHWFD